MSDLLNFHPLYSYLCEFDDIECNFLKLQNCSVYDTFVDDDVDALEFKSNYKIEVDLNLNSQNKIRHKHHFIEFSVNINCFKKSFDLTFVYCFDIFNNYDFLKNNKNWKDYIYNEIDVFLIPDIFEKIKYKVYKFVLYEGFDVKNILTEKFVINCDS